LIQNERSSTARICSTRADRLALVDDADRQPLAQHLAMPKSEVLSDGEPPSR